MIATLLLLAAPALATSDDPVLDFRGGLRTARAGNITGAVGLGVLSLGVISLPIAFDSGEPLPTASAILNVPAGTFTSAAGLPLLTVGALRASRAVSSAGGDISFTPGYLSFTFYAGALAMSVNGLADGWWFDERASYLGPITAGLMIGSYGCGWAQLAAARREGARIGLTRASVPTPRAVELPDFWLSVTPIVGATPGLAITGGF